MNHKNNSEKRRDFLRICAMVKPNSRVLDVGCEDGQLLKILNTQKQTDGRGIEISQKGVNQCVKQGLSVIQGNADTDLVDYPNNAFDYVILSQTIQAMQNPKHVLEQMLRIGKYAIVSFPNFGHWKIRLYLAAKGKMPVTKALPFQWYNTPNIHFCTITDFVELVRELNAHVETRIALDKKGEQFNLNAAGRFANLIATQAIFLLRK